MAHEPNDVAPQDRRRHGPQTSRFAVLTPRWNSDVGVRRQGDIGKRYARLAAALEPGHDIEPRRNSVLRPEAARQINDAAVLYVGHSLLEERCHPGIAVHVSRHDQVIWRDT